MSTHILIPRAQSQSANSLANLMAIGGSTDQRRDTLAELLAQLPSGRFSQTRLATASGDSLAPSESSSGSSTDTHSEETQENLVPRSLDSLGILLVDDLDAEDLNELDQEGVDVVPNLEILLESPVAEQMDVDQDNWHLDKINTSAARMQGLKGAGVRIGILDTGIDDSHPEFTGKSVKFMEFDSRGFKVNATAWDAGHHGTHVSAIAAGATAGVAPAADLAVAAVLMNRSPSGLSGSLAQILAGLNWLMQSNFSKTAVDEVGIINASLGGVGYNAYLHPILNLARTVPGIQLVAAIGNAGPAQNTHGSPGNYDIVIGCGATDVNDNVASFSSWGTVPAHAGIPKPDMCAPGSPVISAIPGGGYAALRGTSMASPMVTGAAALLLEKYPSLIRNPTNLTLALLNQTVNIGQTHKAGRGRLDLSNI